MSKYQVNQAGVSNARRMIAACQHDLDTPWSQVAPSARAANDFMKRHGDGGYGEWHLAIDTETSPESKDRYGLPFGDFLRVSRAALIHAKQRAAQNGHDAVADAAGQLLERLDQAHAA